MTVTKTDHRSIVVLKLPTRMQALITYANGIVKGLTGNPSFPTVVPSLVTISAAIADLQTAETAALERTKGAVLTRDEKKTALVQLLQQLNGTIQTTADANLERGVDHRERRGRRQDLGHRAPPFRLGEHDEGRGIAGSVRRRVPGAQQASERDRWSARGSRPPAPRPFSRSQDPT